MYRKIFIMFPVWTQGDNLKTFLSEINETAANLESIPLGGKTLMVKCFAVIDNRKGDEELSRELPAAIVRRVKPIGKKHNFGRWHTLYTALEYASINGCDGECIMAWCDPEGGLSPTHLTSLVDLMQRGDGIDIAFAQVNWKAEHMSKSERRLHEELRPYHPAMFAVSGKYLRGHESHLLFREYGDHYKKTYGSLPRWGESWSFISAVNYFRSNVHHMLDFPSDYPAVVRSRTQTQGWYAEVHKHLTLSSEFFDRLRNPEVG